jgi:hypothetical protein
MSKNYADIFIWVFIFNFCNNGQFKKLPMLVDSNYFAFVLVRYSGDNDLFL